MGWPASRGWRSETVGGVGEGVCGSAKQSTRYFSVTWQYLRYFSNFHVNIESSGDVWTVCDVCKGGLSLDCFVLSLGPLESSGESRSSELESILSLVNVIRVFGGRERKGYKSVSLWPPCCVCLTCFSTPGDPLSRWRHCLRSCGGSGFKHRLMTKSFSASACSATYIIPFGWLD